MTRWFFAGFLLLGFAMFSCQTTPEHTEAQPSDPVDTKPVENQLPKLELTDATADLLLTWIDEQGDFHVVQKPTDVPEAGRQYVRVVVTTKMEGTGRLVYVADLRQKNEAGQYPVSTMTRAQWNELGADRRKVRLEALLPKEPPATEAASSSPKANGKVDAIIYGADWCKPCHDAEKYLRSLGVNVTKKDIEKSPAARKEMQQKLIRAGKAGASIPVIDVSGQLFVGFNRSVLKHAVDRSLKPQTL